MLELTGGPSSGGMMILLFPPGLMSLIPSSNPTSENVLFSLPSALISSPFGFFKGETEIKQKMNTFFIKLQGNLHF